MHAPAKTPPVSVNLSTLRKQRMRSLAQRAGLAIGLPTLVAALYYGVLASDVYESVSPFTVQSADAGPTGGLESLVGAIPGSSSVKDALAVREYILSRDVLRRLDKEHAFIAHYVNPDVDWVARLTGDSTFEEAYEYYLTQVDVNFDTLSGVLTLRVKAFSAPKAQVFALAILEYSEQMVNDLAQRARRDGIAFAQAEVTKAEARLTKARKAVSSLQAEGADINPEQSAAALLSIRTDLQSELAKARAELSEARSFMRSDSPKVIAINQRVRSLSSQVARQNKTLINPSKADDLQGSIARFEPVLLEKEFAQASYQSAVTSLELARVEASRQHRYLATIAPPSLPDLATHPRRAVGVLTVFALAVVLFGILSLLIASVREHARL